MRMSPLSHKTVIDAINMNYSLKKRIRRFNQKQEIVTGWCNVLLSQKV
jgi:hypothetical protein